MIAQICPENIEPHPSNPRTDVGDVTELAESIRAQGIRQNLLVVPAAADGTYRCVIGHRRLAAARMLSLETVPAIVDDTLTPAQQLELMLVENLQRTNLTPLEEAKGYQDMLDLGIGAREISKRTGRSEKTVTARVRLLKLPEDAQQKVHNGQTTLEDVARLQQFEDNPEQLAQATEALGTADFNWKMNVLERERRRDAERAKTIAHLEALGATPFGKKLTSYTPPKGYVFTYIEDDATEVPEGLKWVEDEFGNVRGLEPRVEPELTPEQLEALEKVEEFKARDAVDKETAKTAWETRDQFVRGLLSKKLSRTQADAVMNAVGERLKRLGWESRLLLEDKARDYLDGLDGPRILLLALHLSMPGTLPEWRSLRCGYGTNHIGLYELLQTLGYQLSTVEAEALAAGKAARIEEDMEDGDPEDPDST